MARFKEYACLLVITAALGVGAMLWQRHSLAYGFEMIEREDPMEKVVWLMGNPMDVEKFGEDGWDEEAPCVLEYSYGSRLWGVLWIFRFDRNDRVLSKRSINNGGP